MRSSNIKAAATALIQTPLPSCLREGLLDSKCGTCSALICGCVVEVKNDIVVDVYFDYTDVEFVVKDIDGKFMLVDTWTSRRVLRGVMRFKVKKNTCHVESKRRNNILLITH
jgi:hypothetical protein